MSSTVISISSVDTPLSLKLEGNWLRLSRVMEMFERRGYVNRLLHLQKSSKVREIQVSRFKPLRGLKHGQMHAAISGSPITLYGIDTRARLKVMRHSLGLPSAVNLPLPNSSTIT